MGGQECKNCHEQIIILWIKDVLVLKVELHTNIVTVAYFVSLLVRFFGILIQISKLPFMLDQAKVQFSDQKTWSK